MSGLHDFRQTQNRKSDGIGDEALVVRLMMQGLGDLQIRLRRDRDLGA